MLTVLLVVGVVVWVLNPYAALLVLGALHLWLLLVSPRTRPARPAALALVALALVPLALLIAFYARELGRGAGRDRLGRGAAARGWARRRRGDGAVEPCASAASWPPRCSRWRRPRQLEDDGIDDGTPLRIRGPLSYAGPGSLGGTESALRR